MLFDQVTYYSPPDDSHDAIQITPSSSNSPTSNISCQFDADFQQKSKTHHHKSASSKHHQNLKRKKIKDMPLDTDFDEHTTKTYKLDTDFNETPTSLSTSLSSFNSSCSPLPPQPPCLYQYQVEVSPLNTELSSISTIFNTSQTLDTTHTKQSYHTQYEHQHSDSSYFQTSGSSFPVHSQTPEVYYNYNPVICTPENSGYFHSQYQYPGQYGDSIIPATDYTSSQYPLYNETAYASDNHYSTAEIAGYYTEVPGPVQASHETVDASYYCGAPSYQLMSECGDNSEYEDSGEDDSGLEESINELDVFNMRQYQRKKRSKGEAVSPSDMSRAAKRKRKRILNHLQRQEATQREKRRMLKLNKAFEDLRKVLPISEFAKNKLSRAETLKSAIEYIEQMSEMLTIG